MTKLCAFGCSVRRAKDITKEHFWGKWLRRAFPDLSRGSHTQHTVTTDLRNKRGDRIGIRPRGKGRLARPGAPISQTLRVVCENCNNGWMGDLQRNAKPLISDMVHGKWPILDCASRLHVARWAIMFTMVYEFADPETMALTPNERLDFKKSLIPRDGWIVAAGNYVGCNHGAAWHRGGSFLEVLDPNHVAAENNNAQTTIFAIGRVVFFTLRYPPRLRIDCAEFTSSVGLFPVWPLNAHALPGRTFKVSDEDVPNIQYAFWNAFDTAVGSRQ
jgi:hypothetical protein